MQVDPNSIVFGGWDISNLSMADAMARAKVLDINLQKQLKPYMQSMVPLPGVFNPDFVAANQGARANNLIQGTKKEQVEQIKKDIRCVHTETHNIESISPSSTLLLWSQSCGSWTREFKEKNKVDKVVVLWTANTERYSNVVAGLNDTMDNLMASLEKNEAEISPSTLYAIACVSEGVPFVNGSPQNTFVPGV